MDSDSTTSSQPSSHPQPQPPALPGSPEASPADLSAVRGAATNAGADSSPGAGGQPAKDPLGKYRGDLRRAEATAARDIDYTAQLPVITIGMMAVLLYFFLPHSGALKGYDVLFYTPLAERLDTSVPERVFATLALVGGVLLTVGTIVSRSWLVAWVNWALAGIGWWYSILAMWMRQSRPATAPGQGPSWGLIVAVVGMTLVFAGLTWLILAKTPLQRALANARREEANRDEESRARQQRLRTGIAPRPVDAPVDDRRRRAKARRMRAEARDTPQADAAEPPNPDVS